VSVGAARSGRPRANRPRPGRERLERAPHGTPPAARSRRRGLSPAPGL